ncbi:hypothetical protein Acr_27g0001980 [Actinidia rufa]|uniref:Retrotransposon gag domain-containing protein n=1 Tax=Actinidia rufa TaxID=165716 RepID=A0A7J0H5Y0_9ERIC|nr:hypothetical protein Acr_27g0001980 [Actinidia rufa]
MHLRSHLLPRPSASSPLDDRAYPTTNTSQAQDLEGLHREIYGMAEQMRIMNKNNVVLIQHLAANNPPPPPPTPVPEIQRSCCLHHSGDDSQNNRSMSAPVTMDALIKQTDPPFTKRVIRTWVSSRFKLPTQLKIYEGKTDPMDHLDSYKSLMAIQGYSDGVMCKAFSATLKGSARSWYKKLSLGTIDSFDELSKLFVAPIS